MQYILVSLINTWSMFLLRICVTSTCEYLTQMQPYNYYFSYNKLLRKRYAYIWKHIGNFFFLKFGESRKHTFINHRNQKPHYLTFQSTMYSLHKCTFVNVSECRPSMDRESTFCAHITCPRRYLFQICACDISHCTVIISSRQMTCISGKHCFTSPHWCQCQVLPVPWPSRNISFKPPLLSINLSL